jgi:hypothetical protein
MNIVIIINECSENAQNYDKTLKSSINYDDFKVDTLKELESKWKLDFGLSVENSLQLSVE